MSEGNVEVMRRGYAAAGTLLTLGKPDDLEAWFADFASPEFEYVPSGGTIGLESSFRGVDGFRRFLRSFWESFEDVRIEPEELSWNGDAVLAQVRFCGKGRQSGAEVNMTLFGLWTFRGERVVRGEGFLSREDLLEAAGPP
jgi:ketosteroid isomerase-like protein